MAVWPRVELVDGATSHRLTTAEGVEDVSFEARDVLVEELDELARCVRGEAKPETGAAEGLAALGVVLAAIESHEQGDGRGVTPGR
jgi:predicted dehydrogenase